MSHLIVLIKGSGPRLVFNPELVVDCLPKNFIKCAAAVMTHFSGVGSRFSGEGLQSAGPRCRLQVPDKSKGLFWAFSVSLSENETKGLEYEGTFSVTLLTVLTLGYVFPGELRKCFLSFACFHVPLSS